HFVGGLLVLRPLLAVAPILVGQLPGFIGDILALLETAQLLLGAQVHPKLTDDRAELNQLALELVDLGVGAPPLILACEALDTLDQHPAVPRAVEDRDHAARRQPPPEAVEVVMHLIVAGWRGDRMDDIAAWVELFRDALDGAALTGRIPTFEHQYDGP